MKEKEQTELQAGSQHWLKNIEHEHRSVLLGEMHARPFHSISLPRHFFHYGFLVDEEDKKSGRRALESLVKSVGGTPPSPGEKYWKSSIGGWDLRWEEHTEFATYSWGCAPDSDTVFIQTPPDPALRPSGKLLVAAQLLVVSEENFNTPLENLFNPNSLCVIDIFDGSARIVTDFQADLTGHTRILIIDKSLGERRRGAVVQRILEIESYRIMALLGLPVTRKQAPKVKHIEDELAEITKEISEAKDMESNHKLLDKLTSLAAQMEAQVAETAFRFGAGRAYFNIVQARLKAIGEKPVPEYITFTSFFSRGLKPAILTYDAIEKRQSDLSRRLVRTAELLRTRIQFELEHQNRNSLRSMDRRARMQLRLQQTVEGLSVIAISYYTVGLVSYIFNGLKISEEIISKETLTAISVPLVVLLVWGVMYRVRKKLHE